MATIEDPNHVRILPDGSVSDGSLCERFRDACDACKAIFRRDFDSWAEANGGQEGLRRRAELANAYARERGGPGVGIISEYEIQEVYLYQMGFCGRPADDNFCEGPPADRWEIDHMTPITRGGKNTFENIQLLCAPCNKDKGNRTLHEWRNGLPARYEEWTDCEECGKRIRACYRLCYECKFG